MTTRSMIYPPSEATMAPNQTETGAKEPRGVPTPVSRRMINPKLYPATWIRYRLWTFSRPVHLGRDHRAGVQVHRMLGLVGQMRAAILQPGDPRVRIGGA